MSAKKNLSLIVLAGAVGYLIYRRSLTAQENLWSTVAAPVAPGTSGLGGSQVRIPYPTHTPVSATHRWALRGYMPAAKLSSAGGTNMLAGLPGVWVPESSSWDKPGVDGFDDGLSGFGSKLRKAASKATSIAKTVAISAVPIVGPSLALKRVVATTAMPASIKKIASAAATMSIPIVGAAMVTKQVVSSKGTSLVTMPGPKGNGAPAAVPATVQAPDGTTSQQIVYQDAVGNVITKPQYDAIMSSLGATPPQPVLVQDGSNPPTYGGMDGTVWSYAQALPYLPKAADTASVVPTAQSASTSNSTPITYSDTQTTSSGGSSSQGNIIMPDGTVLDSSGNPIPQAPAQPTGRFDAQASGSTDTSSPTADAPANTPSGGGKVALLLAAAGAGAFFLFKK